MKRKKTCVKIIRKIVWKYKYLRKNWKNDVFFTTFCDALIIECTTTGAETLNVPLFFYQQWKINTIKCGIWKNDFPELNDHRKTHTLVDLKKSQLNTNKNLIWLRKENRWYLLGTHIQTTRSPILNFPFWFFCVSESFFCFHYIFSSIRLDCVGDWTKRKRIAKQKKLCQTEFSLPYVFPFVYLSPFKVKMHLCLLSWKLEEQLFWKIENFFVFRGKHRIFPSIEDTFSCTGCKSDLTTTH